MSMESPSVGVLPFTSVRAMPGQMIGKVRAFSPTQWSHQQRYINYPPRPTDAWVSHGHATSRETGILQEQASKCFFYLTSYFKFQGKRKCTQDELTMYVSFQDVSNNNTGGVGSTEHSASRGPPLASEAACSLTPPAIIIDPLADTWGDAAVWCNTSYENEFNTTRLCILDGNMYREGMNILNGATICGPFHAESGTGAIKSWMLSFEATGNTAPFALIKITLLRTSPTDMLSASLEKYLNSPPLYMKFTCKLLWAVHQVLQRTLNDRMKMLPLIPPSILFTFATQHLEFVSQMCSEQLISDASGSREQKRQALVSSMLDSCVFFFRPHLVTA